MANEKKTTESMKLIAGIDVGNGYTKSIINNGIAVTQSHAVKRYSIIEDTKFQDEQYPEFIQDISNLMDCSFTSPLVTDTTRRLFGDRALRDPLPVEQFDTREGKALNDLYGCLLLTTLATYVLKQHHIAKPNEMPTKLSAEVYLATALPIDEFKQKNREFREKILNKNQPHYVNIHNFQQLITVELTIKAVHVASEGESAQYGLMGVEGPLIKDVEDEIKRHYGNLYEGFTGEDFLTAPNTLGIDIGDGTMDFAVFINNKFDRNLSHTIAQGYRTVLENTLDELSTKGATYSSTKELDDALTHPPVSKFEQKRWQNAHQVKNKYIMALCDFIRDECSKTFSRVGSFTNVVFVYGGGASALKEQLYPRLDKLSEQRGDDARLPIVYLDDKYSQLLNTQGLYLLANTLSA